MADTSFNPLDCWCPHVVESILQHLAIKELLMLSEVSPNYWSFISRYLRFRRRVVFTLSPSRKVSQRELIALMKNLRRIYESFAAIGSEVTGNLEVVSKQHTWRYVKLSNMVFNRPTLLQNFINEVRGNVEEFVMSSVFIFNCDKNVMLSLPKTRRLEMFECNDQENPLTKRISFVITDCVELNFLKLHFAGVSDINQRRLVQANKNLKTLSVVDVCDEFFEGFAKLPIKLENLSVKFSESRDLSRLNFINFIVSQTRHLKSLEVSGWVNAELFEVAYRMPQLSFLKISHARVWLAKIDDLEFEQRLDFSLSLCELKLSEDLTPFQDIWEELVYKAPRLKNFRIET